MNLLTEKVIGAVFEVSNTLGSGFLEKVYERALVTGTDVAGYEGGGAGSADREL